MNSPRDQGQKFWGYLATASFGLRNSETWPIKRDARQFQMALASRARDTHKCRPCHADARCSRLGRGHQYACGPLPPTQRGRQPALGRRCHAKPAVWPIELCSKFDEGAQSRQVRDRRTNTLNRRYPQVDDGGQQNNRCRLLLNARRFSLGFGRGIVWRQNHSAGGVVPRYLAVADPLGVLIFHPLIGLLSHLFLLVVFRSE